MYSLCVDLREMVVCRWQVGGEEINTGYMPDTYHWIPIISSCATSQMQHQGYTLCSDDSISLMNHRTHPVVSNNWIVILGFKW